MQHTHTVRLKCVTKCGWAQFAQAAMESQFVEAFCASMPLHFPAFHVLLFHHLANMTRKIKPNVCEVLDSFSLFNPLANSTLTSTFDLFNLYRYVFNRRWKIEPQLNWSSRKLWSWQSNSLCRKKKELKSIIFRRTTREKFTVLWILFIFFSEHCDFSQIVCKSWQISRAHKSLFMWTENFPNDGSTQINIWWKARSRKNIHWWK